MSSGRPRAVSSVHFFVFCQINVVNKQLFSPISWNKPLSKVKLHSLNTVMPQFVIAALTCNKDCPNL